MNIFNSHTLNAVIGHSRFDGMTFDFYRIPAMPKKGVFKDCRSDVCDYGNDCYVACKSFSHARYKRKMEYVGSAFTVAFMRFAVENISEDKIIDFFDRYNKHLDSLGIDKEDHSGVVFSLSEISGFRFKRSPVRRSVRNGKK